jgi:hypothetical protein
MALIACNDCGNQVSTQAKACPKCGRKIDKPWSEVGVFLLFLFVGVPVLFLGFAFLGAEPRSPGSVGVTSLDNEGLKAEGRESAVAACALAQAFTRESLKAPATAQFQTCRDNDVTFMADGSFVVFVTVDSQNGFGATLRTKYRASFGKQNGKFTVTDFIEVPR